MEVHAEISNKQNKAEVRKGKANMSLDMNMMFEDLISLINSRAYDDGDEKRHLIQTVRSIQHRL